MNIAPSTVAKPPLGWIGTGIMGLPMAGHLQAAGYPLVVYNRTPARAQPLVQAGARLVSSPAELADCCSTIFCCVCDTPDVEAVLLGPEGVLAGVRRKKGSNLLVVDHSTIHPQATQQMAAVLAREGVGFLDAPVSGGEPGAKKGTLSIMVGGSVPLLERVRPFLACYGQTITHCGPNGYGQFTKMANQIAGALHALAFSEAISYGRSAGLDLGKMLAAVGSGASASWALSHLAPRAAQGDFAPGFMVDLLQKDLRIVLDSAGRLGAVLPGTALVQQLFAANQAHGEGREGTQALVKTLLRLAKKGG